MLSKAKVTIVVRLRIIEVFPWQMRFSETSRATGPRWFTRETICVPDTRESLPSQHQHHLCDTEGLWHHPHCPPRSTFSQLRRRANGLAAQTSPRLQTGFNCSAPSPRSSLGSDIPSLQAESSNTRRQSPHHPPQPRQPPACRSFVGNVRLRAETDSNPLAPDLGPTAAPSVNLWPTHLAAPVLILPHPCQSVSQAESLPPLLDCPVRLLLRPAFSENLYDHTCA